MNKIKLSDLNLLDFGNSIQLSACIYSTEGQNYLCVLPDEFQDEIVSNPLSLLEITPLDWEKILRQTDLLETEVRGGTVKAILRKSQRLIDTNMMWGVYRRDHYTCRYCGRNDVPLSVDHIILWEDGGPTLAENLLTACKPCNGSRSNMPYEKWLNSDRYKFRSVNLTEDQKNSNISIVSQLEYLKTLKYEKQRSR